ncbi:MAG: TRAP-T-associated universal stress protein TeaD [Ignavibacteriaceae bacterium]|nr:TRAP-T-associated universal stress protein TeaD [Ignavibacteriaceae bacterium]MCK6613218.1 universal stress protein [Ignavibacteriaceae bacterium]
MKIDKILVPVDFSDYSIAALKYSTEFALVFGAELVVAYVLEPMMYPPDLTVGQIPLPPYEAEVSDKAKTELEKLVEPYQNNVRITTIVRAGKPFLEIVDLAKETDADLIIISSHGRTGMEHLLFGGTSEKVIRKAPCPVLTLRNPEKGFNFKEVKQG